MKIRDRRGRNRFFVDNAFFRGGWAKVVGPFGIAIYNALVLHADIEDQSAWPSYQTLANLTGMSRRQAIREIDRLIEYNLVIVQHRCTIKGDSDSNEYILTHVEEWNSPRGGDSQSLGVVTHSHQGGDSQSPKQDSVEQNPINNLPDEEKTSSSDQEFDSLFPREEEENLSTNGKKERLNHWDALMGGRVGNGADESETEKRIHESGWVIKGASARSIRQALIIFLTYTRFNVPQSDSERGRYYKVGKNLADEFTPDELRKLLPKIEKEYTDLGYNPPVEAYLRRCGDVRAGETSKPQQQTLRTEDGGYYL